LAAAHFLKRVYDTLKNTDSAYYYLQLQYAFRDSVFSQEKTNKIQSLEFSEQIRITEEEVKKIKEEEQRRQNIQYVLIALGIITFIILFLVLSHSITINTKLIEFFGVIALLIVFEFLNLLLHPFLERITHHSPVLMLLALVCIAALLVPLHHKLENGLRINWWRRIKRSGWPVLRKRLKNWRSREMPDKGINSRFYIFC
jgi:hypothetical protein